MAWLDQSRTTDNKAKRGERKPLLARMTSRLVWCALVAGCSISGESTSSLSVASTAEVVKSTVVATVAASVPATTLIAPTTLESTTTAAPQQVVSVDQLVTPQAVAEVLNRAGLGCADLELEGDAASGSASFESSKAACTLLGGIRINVLVMADQRVAALSDRILAGLSKLMKKAGVQELAFVEAGPDGMVWVNLEMTAKHLTPRPTDAERATLELLASALHGTVRSVTA